MTTLDSSSAAESTMDESSNNLQQPPSSATTDRRFHGGIFSDEEHNSKGSEVVWSNFTDSFREVQSVLDRNRVLIHQVNENHRSKIHENMVTNVALIQEINSNVSKIVSLYSDLSTNFSSVFHQRESDGVNKS